MLEGDALFRLIALGFVLMCLVLLPLAHGVDRRNRRRTKAFRDWARRHSGDFDAGPTLATELAPMQYLEQRPGVTRVWAHNVARGTSRGVTFRLFDLQGVTPDDHPDVWTTALLLRLHGRRLARFSFATRRDAERSRLVEMLFGSPLPGRHAFEGSHTVTWPDHPRLSLECRDREATLALFSGPMLAQLELGPWRIEGEGSFLCIGRVRRRESDTRVAAADLDGFVDAALEIGEQIERMTRDPRGDS